MAEHLDDQATIERTLLWEDITETFQREAFTAGMHRKTDISLDTPTSIWFVLESEYSGEHYIELWAQPGRQHLIGRVMMYYFNDDEDQTACYELFPDDITQYDSDGLALDKAHFEDLRADLAEAVWDAAGSQQLAKDCFIDL